LFYDARHTTDDGWLLSGVPAEAAGGSQVFITSQVVKFVIERLDLKAVLLDN